ncbi:hypothetical protein EJB05_00671, partial [Eragrostis curvula]
MADLGAAAAVDDEADLEAAPSQDPAAPAPSGLLHGVTPIFSVPNALQDESDFEAKTILVKRSHLSSSLVYEQPMVEKGCESCRKWQEHYYWKHMDVSKIRFFKLMTGDFTRGFSIPEKFVKNFKITKQVDLQAPSGETWRMGVEKHDDELYLMSGWEDFVKAQELQENDLLIFTCSGNSSFDVLIFEASGCVKVSSLLGPNMCKHFNSMAGRQVEHYSLSDSDGTSMPSRLVRSLDNASTSKESSGRELDSPNSSSRHVNHETMEEEDSDDIYSGSMYYYSRVANRLTDDHKKQILSLAPIGTYNPAFVTVLQKSHCRQRNNNLTIPMKFTDHLEAKSHDIILRRPKRKEKWSVKYYYTQSNRYFKHFKFFNFVRENKIREGGICVFELMKRARRVSMTVHVIRMKVDGRFALMG